jgi:hypothetical protein
VLRTTKNTQRSAEDEVELLQLQSPLQSPLQMSPLQMSPLQGLESGRRQLCRTADHCNSERRALGETKLHLGIEQLAPRSLTYGDGDGVSARARAQRQQTAKKYQQRKQQHTRHLSRC